MTIDLALVLWLPFVLCLLLMAFWAVWLYSKALDVEDRVDGLWEDYAVSHNQMHDRIDQLEESVKELTKLIRVWDQHLKAVPTDDEIEALIAQRRRERTYAKQEDEFYTIET